MKYLIAVALLALIAGCGNEGPISNAEVISIRPGGISELCFESKEGDRVLYRFEADSSLSFNLHYHIDTETFYTVPKHETSAEKGEFLVPRDNAYCLMWENTAENAVRLSVHLEGVGKIERFGDQG